MNIYTVKSFAKRHPQIVTEAALRNYIARSNPIHTSKGKQAGNGFDAVCFRKGRRIYIQEDKFFEWLTENSKLNIDREL